MRTRISQPETRPLAELLLHPFQEFVHAETSSGILLLICTIIALFMANSPWAHNYEHLWELHFTLGFPDARLDEPLHLWINDGLMALFFLLVGLEIKRELLVGELSTLGQAILPLVAALGGAILPALAYAAFTWGSPALKGWGIPMATDIAFALGVLIILGKRLPVALRIFLTALAIFDDLIAIVTIAIFYSHGLKVLPLAWAGGLFVSLILCNLAGLRMVWVYALLGLGLWLAFLLSGIHATIAGVLLALAIPVRARIDATTFLNQSREVLDEFASSSAPGFGLVMSERQQTALNTLSTTSEKVQAPLSRMEHILHLPVPFLIVPLFVLANAGVSLQGVGSSIFTPVSLGIAVGLVVGKQVGITLFSWLIVKLGWAQLPQGVTFGHIYAVSWLGGIGFTMSLFIDNLAFPEQETLLKDAKVGILLSLLVSSMVGFFLLYWLGRAEKGEQEASL